MQIVIFASDSARSLENGARYGKNFGFWPVWAQQIFQNVICSSCLGPSCEVCLFELMRSHENEDNTTTAVKDVKMSKLTKKLSQILAFLNH